MVCYHYKDACTRLGISYNTLQKRIQEGKLKPVDGRITGAELLRVLRAALHAPARPRMKDVESHVMEIFKEDGLHQHIRFRRPGTTYMQFDLISWPGYLCYTGDMGTYVFQRLEDMLKLFRADRAYAKLDGKRLGVNQA